MNASSIPTINRTVQLTNEWIAELSDRLEWNDPRRAFTLLRAYLQTLRDHLNVNEAADLAAQLPILVRGIYFEGWQPARTPSHDRSINGFIAAIEKRMGDGRMQDTASAIGAVIALLENRISDGEIDDIVNCLPKNIRDFWRGQSGGM